MIYLFKTSFLRRFFVIIFLLIFALSFKATVSADWQGPTADPPANNRPVPLDISAVAQTKAGNLTLQGTFIVDQVSTFNDEADFLNGIYVDSQPGNWAGYFYNNPVGIESSLAVGMATGGYLVVGGQNTYGYDQNGDAYFYNNVGVKNELHVAPTGNGQICLNGTDPADCISAWPEVSSSLWVASGNNIYNANTGNVGIGTQTPVAKLDVAGGDIVIDHLRKLSSRNSIGNITSLAELDSSNYYLAAYGQVNGWTIGGTTHSSISGDHNSEFITMRTDDNERLRISQAGNIGISTADPWDKLQIGTSLVLHDGGNDVMAFGWSPGAGKALQPGYPAEIRYDGVTGLLQLGISPVLKATGDSTTSSSFTKVINVTKDGKVGIRTTTPTRTFEVQAPVGTTFPSTGTDSNAALVDTTAMEAGVGGAFTLYGNYKTEGGNTLAAGFKAFKDNSTSNEWGFGLGIGTRLNGSTNLSEVMRLTSTGYVGIGTTNPNYKLDVVGDINTSDNLCIDGDCIDRWSDISSGNVGLMSDNFGMAVGDAIASLDLNEQPWFMTYDGANILVSVSNVGSGSAVYKVQPGSNVAKKITAGLTASEGARGITYDGQGYWLAVNGPTNAGVYYSEDGNSWTMYSGGGDPYDMIFTGKYIIVSGYRIGQNSNKINTYDNPHLGLPNSHSYTNTESNRAPFGLLYDGEYIWYTTRSTESPGLFSERKLGKLAIAADGTLSLAGYFDLGDTCGTRFMAFDGTNIWLTCYETASIKKVSRTGQVLGTYAFPGGNITPYDIVFDGQDLWVSGNVQSRVYRFKPALEQFVNCDGSVAVGTPQGCDTSGGTWSLVHDLLFDGTYVYAANKGDASVAGSITRVYSGKGFGHHMPASVSELTVDDLDVTYLHSGAPNNSAVLLADQLMVGNNIVAEGVDLLNNENLIYGNVKSTTTGDNDATQSLLKLQRSASDKFKIDLDGNQTLAGQLTAGSNSLVVANGASLISGNMDTSSLGNLLTLKKEGVNKFSVANNGNLTMTGKITSQGLQLFNNHETGATNDMLSVVGEGANYNLLNLYHYYWNGEDFWSSRFSVNYQGQLMVGSDTSIVNIGENLFYGNMDASSFGNLLLLQKEGIAQFTIDKDGNIMMEGELRMNDNRIRLGTNGIGPTIEASGGNVIIRLGE